MTQPQSAAESILVGIDGSNTAIDAAKWALAEATSRDVPLRLVYVTRNEGLASPTQGVDLDMEYAETALRTATTAIHAMGGLVKVETAVIRGSPEIALIAESRYAAMVCVGSVGIGRIAHVLLGSTATALAHKAHCPVAIIRTDHDGPASDAGWVGCRRRFARQRRGTRARLPRGATAQCTDIGARSLAVGSGRDSLQPTESSSGPVGGSYREVHVRPAAARAGAAEFLARTEEPVQLAVVGSDAAGHIARIVGRVGHSLLSRAAYSALVVRS